LDQGSVESHVVHVRPALKGKWYIEDRRSRDRLTAGWAGLWPVRGPIRKTGDRPEDMRRVTGLMAAGLDHGQRRVRRRACGSGLVRELLSALPARGVHEAHHLHLVEVELVAQRLALQRGAHGVEQRLIVGG